MRLAKHTLDMNVIGNVFVHECLLWYYMSLETKKNAEIICSRSHRVWDWQMDNFVKNEEDRMRCRWVLIFPLRKHVNNKESIKKVRARKTLIQEQLKKHRKDG